jgi:putative acetyltransferase
VAHGADVAREARVTIAIRPARAPILAAAERAIAAEPGFLASLPSELVDDRFAQKIAALAQADNGCFLVAEADGRIVGHGVLDPLPLARIRHVVHLTLVAHPGWQGRGVGRALLAALIAWARATPAVEKIELNVRASNTRAQALYLAMGFTEMGRWQRRHKLGPGVYLDDVAMELFVES